MKKHIIRYASFAFAILGMVSCSEEQETALRPQDAKSTPMTFLVSHPGQATRATETSFEQNDRIGLYVADAKAQLEIGGNLVNNEALTYDGSKWAAARTLYWDKGTYTAYAYYPYLEDVSSITDQPFSVVLDQSTAKSKEAMGGYEASDLLFASSKNISASASPIPLNFKHIMSKLKIRLIKGEDFEGDMPTTAQVTIHNTVPTATIDLQAGVATRNAKGLRRTITAHHGADYLYSAIVVPQRVDNRMPLIEVVMNGMSYLYESKFQFKAGMEQLVNLIIPNNPDNIRIDIGGGIKNWD